MRKILLAIMLLTSISANSAKIDAQTLLNKAYDRPTYATLGNITIERVVPKYAVMSSAPPADAKRLTVYGHEIAIYQNQIFEDLVGWRVVVKSDGDWLYVDEVAYAPSSIKNRADADARVGIILAEINSTIYDTLRPSDPTDPEPANGKELMQYILNALCVKDDEVSACN